MKQHPLSAAFPLPTPAEFDSLRDDIREHGQRHPIIVYQGMVLDGWTRFRACAELNKEPYLKEYGGDDPAGYVLSSNLHRRHLSASQRAGAIVACNEWRGNGSRAPHKLGSVAELPQTAAQLAETAQVSERLIVDAKAAHKAGFGEALRDGKTTATKAASLARKPLSIDITPEAGKALSAASLKMARSFAPPESMQVAQLTAEKEALEAELAEKIAEILELELAGVDEGARNEARDKIQGYVDAMHDAMRQEQAALALLNEANYKNGELMRTNIAQGEQIKALNRRLAELQK